MYYFTHVIVYTEMKEWIMSTNVSLSILTIALLFYYYKTADTTDNIVLIIVTAY